MASKKKNKQTSKQTTENLENQPEEKEEENSLEKESSKNETTLANVTDASLDLAKIKSPILADIAKNSKHPAFLERYGSRLERIERPTTTNFATIVEGLSEEHYEKVVNLIKKMDTERPGLYLADNRPQFTELRLYQGTGSDPNRPDNCRVGDFYFTTKRNVGSAFVGAVVALWQGRTMWPGADEARGAPLCSSMDRQVGSKYGTCATCPERPWNKGEKTRCNDDVVVFMLPPDLDDLVLVRFSRTSEAAGRQLSKLVAKDLVPWRRFFRITSAERQGGGGASIKWHVMRIDAHEDETMSPELNEFCAALCSTVEHDFILPGLASIYNSAAEVDIDTLDEDSSSTNSEKAQDVYDEFDSEDDNI